ncbi:unnamed protein product [Coffea canephora]|uniref:Uncharacterized protein n=1 Tax=Coffea canephora TaxID=49390 RepID=A0A068V3T9_COFCA|nr:unnamed protein product [Coffea canephora]
MPPVYVSNFSLGFRTALSINTGPIPCAKTRKHLGVCLKEVQPNLSSLSHSCCWVLLFSRFGEWIPSCLPLNL